eukprot:2725218-Pleurochrysis_carterae.AAC.2
MGLRLRQHMISPAAVALRQMRRQARRDSHLVTRAQWPRTAPRDRRAAASSARPSSGATRIRAARSDCAPAQLSHATEA